MSKIRRLLTMRRSLSWLLWLALLLPMAQSAGVWHVYSHLRPERADLRDGQQAAHAVQCDLCLSAATVAGGAPTAAASPPSFPGIRHPSPLDPGTSVWLALPSPAYSSRAPPLA